MPRGRSIVLVVVLVGGGLVPRRDNLLRRVSRGGAALGAGLSLSRSLRLSLRRGPLRERPLAEVGPRVGRERLLVPVDAAISETLNRNSYFHLN